MRSYIAAVAFVASVNAYAYPAYNATSTPIYETPVYTATPIYETPVYTTKVVTELTTVCPTPTEITYGTKTYTVTEATTLTITDCPCTVTEEVPSYPTKPAVTKSLSVPPPPAVTHNVPYPSKNVTVPVYPPHATGTGAPSSTGPSPPAFTGAAAQAGVGLLAVVGALAAFL